MKTVDKFGRYRGFHGGVSPKGMGFGLDKNGNYDMRNKQIKRVGQPSEPNDAVTLQVVRLLWDHVNFNTEKLTAIPKKIPQFLDEYIEKHKQEKLIPLFTDLTQQQTSDYVEKYKEEKIIPLIKDIVVEAIETPKSKIEACLDQYIDQKLKEKRLKISKMEEEIKKIKADAQSELKAVADMTRAFVYKVTAPDFRRNSNEQETGIHKNLRDKNKTWRHAFPEVNTAEEMARRGTS